jgi:hypothetical protein
MHAYLTLSDFLVNPRAPKRLKLGVIPFFATKSVVKSCSKRKKLLEVARAEKSCSKCKKLIKSCGAQSEHA